MKRRVGISIIWLIFVILFFCLAGIHWAESKQTIPELKVTAPTNTVTVNIGGSDYGDFVRKFNKYVTNQNESNQKANLYAYRGYLLAGLTALFAMGLELQEYIFALLAKLILLVKSQETSKNNK